MIRQLLVITQIQPFSNITSNENMIYKNMFIKVIYCLQEKSTHDPLLTFYFELSIHNCHSDYKMKISKPPRSPLHVITTYVCIPWHHSSILSPFWKKQWVFSVSLNLMIHSPMLSPYHVPMKIQSASKQSSSISSEKYRKCNIMK